MISICEEVQRTFAEWETLTKTALVSPWAHRPISPACIMQTNCLRAESDIQIAEETNSRHVCAKYFWFNAITCFSIPSSPNFLKCITWMRERGGRGELQLNKTHSRTHPANEREKRKEGHKKQKNKKNKQQQQGGWHTRTGRSKIGNRRQERWCNEGLLCYCCCRHRWMRFWGVLDCAFASHLWFYHNALQAAPPFAGARVPNSLRLFLTIPKSSYQLEFSLGTRSRVWY